MKNITVTVDDETYRRARVVAAERDTSVSALVRDFLNGLESGESRFERLMRLEQELRKRVPPGFSASDNLSREELYDRQRFREE